MESISQKRQLAAIMFTDLVGYTALMGKDEAAALEMLKNNRRIHTDCLNEYNGRWLKEMGDGILSSFSTISDAVYCAKAIQKASSAIDGMEIRIGIHVGEVVVEKGDVFGGGVNIASRIQSLAVPGSILVSEPVFQEVKNNREIQIKRVGRFDLKNIEKPVEVYAVANPGLTVPSKEDIAFQNINVPGSITLKITPRIIMFTLLVVATGFLVYFLISEYKSSSEGVGQDIEKSIAVLPFTNMSNDPDQDYFSDGMMEEILNHLYKIGDLLVTSRTSVMRYRGTTKPITEIAKELGVSTILEGSVRKSGNRVRITVQLIDGKTDKHLWSETYDRTLDDIFAIQSEVAQSIASTLLAEIHPEVRMRIESQPTTNTDAYDLFLEATRLSSFDEDENEQAIAILEEVIRLDPSFGRAYSSMGARLQTGATFFASEGGIDPSKAWIMSKPYIEKALTLDPEDGLAHIRMAWSLLWFEWDFEQAGIEYQKAKEIFPNYSWTDFLIATGNFQEAADGAEKSMEIDPTAGLSWASIIVAQYFAGEHQKVWQNIQIAVKDSLQRYNLLTLIEVTRVSMYLGRYEQAREISSMIDEHWLELESPRIMTFQAITEYHLGNHSEVSAIVKRIEERSKVNAGGSPSYFLAMINSEMGETDLAFQWLDKGYEDHEVEMYWLKVEPPFKALHDDPRWQEMLNKVGFPE